MSGENEQTTVSRPVALLASMSKDVPQEVRDWMAQSEERAFWLLEVCQDLHERVLTAEADIEVMDVALADADDDARANAAYAAHDATGGQQGYARGSLDSLKAARAEQRRWWRSNGPQYIGSHEYFADVEDRRYVPQGGVRSAISERAEQGRVGRLVDWPGSLPDSLIPF